MRRPQRIPNKNGFTIIEVLIVLAIAGIIMVLIFMAVPSLVRNNRNSERRQDIAKILASLSHYELENSGGFPTDCGPQLGTPAKYCTVGLMVGPTKLNDYYLQYEVNSLVYYDPANIETVGGTPGISPANPPVTINNVYVTNYQKCDPNNPGNSTPSGAGYNDVVALFAVESGSSTVDQCQEI